MHSFCYSDATLQFLDSVYSIVESELFIVPVVQLLTEIATDVTVRIVPVNITEALARELPSTFPTIPPFDRRVPYNATSKLRSRLLTIICRRVTVSYLYLIGGADFSTTPLELTFPAGDARILTLFPGISILDDDINEAVQIFALILEVADAIAPDRVDLQSERFASLARIFDDDRKGTYVIHKGIYWH